MLFSSLQALTSIITLSFLKLRLASVKFDTAAAQPYRVSDIWGAECPSFLTPKDVGEINEIFLKAAESERLSVSPALFAWGTIMFSVREIALSTREERELQQAQHAVDAYNGGTSATQTLRENHSSVYEDAFERARNPAFDDDFVKFMISIAVDRCRVFDVVCAVIRELDNISGLGDGNLVAQWARVELLDLIRASLDFVEYIPELLTAVLQIITTPNTEWDCTSIRTTESRCEAKAIFLHDDTLMGKIFRVAKSRFPYEAINFLKLCRSLIDCNLSTDEGYPLIFQELESMDTYTQIISAGFQGYQSTREDENANFVSLIEPLEMKELSSTKIDGGNPVESQLLVLNESSILPADTLGQVVNDSKPAIIMWQHRYNCISFLGVWLEQATSSRKAGHEPDDNVVAEIIGLLADLVASSQVVAKRRKIESCAKRILEVASDGLNHHGDIITAVFDIFERNLQTATTKVGTDRGLEIITGCTSFLNALVTVIPGRVWPFLTRSSLLAGDGAGGTLPAIVSAVEVNTGDFSFLLETIRTFRLIVDDAVRHLAVRKTAGNVTAKSAHVTEYTAAAPSHIMSSLLQSFVRVMVDIYNNSASWRYNDIRQLLRLNTSLTDTFQDIIYYTYGVDDTQNLDSKLTAVFANSARYLLSMLRPSSKENIFFNPVLRVILSGFQNPLLTGNMYLRCLQSRLVESSLKLSITLIQAGSAQHPGTTGLERQLFNATPVLIRLYVLHQDYQLPIVNLLELLVTHASLDPEQEPPSLLGHLGGQSSCRFLDILSKFDRPFHDIVFNTSIWKFLTAVISRRQQWLAVLLLTGTSPRDALKKTDQTGTTMKSKPFLDAAIDTILGFRKTSRLMVSALEFIAKAQESWPWATPQLAYHSSFLPRMADYIASINIRRLSPYEQCMTTKLASLFADICAVYLHRSIERGERSLFKALIPLIQWYAENAIEVDGYNASLHTNLRRNFEMKYPGCNLFSIKKTTLSSPTFGKHFFYDIVLGTKVFGYEFAWIGSRNQGFVDEVQRANENLSLVQAQMVRKSLRTATIMWDMYL